MPKKTPFQLATIVLLASVLTLSVPVHGLVSSKQDKIKKLYPLLQQRLEKSQFSEAREILVEMLRLMEKKGMREKEYVRLVRELVRVEIRLKQLNRAQQLLEQTETNELPSAAKLTLQLAWAELASAKGQYKEAYRLFEQLESLYPLASWPEGGLDLFLEVENHLDQEYGKFLLDAERFFKANLYEEAAQLYGSVWNAIIAGEYPASKKLPNCHRLVNKVRYRFAEALFNLKEFEHVLEAFGGKEIQGFLGASDREEFYNHSLYLLSKTFRELGEYSRAIDMLQRYLTTKGAHKLPSYYEAHWELGCNYYALGQLEQAANHFRKMGQSPNDRLKVYGHLFLAKFYLLQRDPMMASVVLQLLFNTLSATDPCYIQALVLNGQCSIEKGEYLVAKSIFHQALHELEDSRRSGQWETQRQQLLSSETIEQDILFYMAYINVRSVEHHEISDIKGALQEAKSYFEKIQLFPNYTVKSLIGLLRVDLLAKENGLPELVNTTEVFKHFRGKASREEAIEIGMLKAMASSDENEKEKLLRKLLRESGNDVENYFELNYQWAYFCLERALNCQESHWGVGKDYLEESYHTYTKLMAYLKNNRTLASSALCGYVQSALLLGEKESLLHAAQFATDNKISQYSLSQEERHFFNNTVAQIGIALAERYGELRWLDTSVNLYEQLCKETDLPKEGHAEVVFGLGKVCYLKKDYQSAQKAWEQYLKEFSNGVNEADSLYFLSQVYEIQGKQQVEVAHLRKMLYTKFPTHPYADRAYFSYYPLVSYLEGAPQELDHLQMMVELFPESKLLIHVHYLLGLAYKKLYHQESTANNTPKSDSITLEQALTHLQIAGEKYHQLCSQDSLDDRDRRDYANIASLSILERAKMGIKLAEESEDLEEGTRAIEYSIKMLEELTAQLSPNSSHLMSKELWQNQQIPAVYEEALYSLSLLYSHADDELSAEEMRKILLDLYKANGVSQGYYLSKVWLDRASILEKQHNWAAVLEALLSASSAAGESWSQEEQFEFWLRQANCYRHIELYPEALRALAHIIAHEKRTPFHDEAIFRRGEIYEMMGKEYLAIKQYEAMAKRDGQWRDRACDKLSNLTNQESVGDAAGLEFIYENTKSEE
jgi:TolA-binding protein